MTKTGHVQVRIDLEVKQSAENIFAKLGFTSSDAVRMFYHQVTLNNGLPFDVKIPNKETKQAITDIQNGVDLKSYDSTGDMLKDLDL